MDAAEEVGCPGIGVLVPDAEKVGRAVGRVTDDVIRRGVRRDLDVHVGRFLEAGECGVVVGVEAAVDVEGFLGRCGVATCLHGAGVVATGAVGRDLRDREGGKNADDGDDDQELDQGESFAVLHDLFLRWFVECFAGAQISPAVILFLL